MRNAKLDSLINLGVPFVIGLALILAEPPLLGLEAGIKTTDITPSRSIWLAGYAGRKQSSEKVDSRLVASALALKDEAGERIVIVSLDNCMVNHAFMAPVLAEVNTKNELKAGAVMVVCSHTHSAPVLVGVMNGVYSMGPEDRARVAEYSRTLREKLVETIDGALADLKPAKLEHGRGRATFAMNRRVYQEDKVIFGENPDGPVDWDVEVLKVSGTNDTVRAVVFGYACHGTSIQGDDAYIVSGDYMAYARDQLEAHFPGATAMYITGMGADSNPSPRGKLLYAKQHGLELAGAVAGVLAGPLRPVAGKVRWAYEEADLPLEQPPTREKLDADAKSTDPYVRGRAESHLKLLAAGENLNSHVKLPLAAVRIGEDLTFVAMGGEDVVDYGRKFKRLFAAEHPWLIGYAYEVPCYIPSVRILKEGGYEVDTSLVLYGIYGPFRASVEEILTRTMTKLVSEARNVR